MHELGVLPQPVSQSRNVAAVYQFNGSMEERVSYAFVMR